MSNLNESGTIPKIYGLPSHPFRKSRSNARQCSHCGFQRGSLFHFEPFEWMPEDWPQSLENAADAALGPEAAGE